MKKIYLLLLIAILGTSCKPRGSQGQSGSDGKPVITVTIEPLRYFTEAIAGDRFTVTSMVPKGTSPETYDPSPQQLVDLARSKAYFRIGYIGFEQSWVDRLTDNAPHLQFFDTSRGIDLIYDDTHHHHETDGKEASDGHSHAGGVEPHVWNSTTNAQIIAGNILNALCTIDKANETIYVERYNALCKQIAHTDSLIRRELSRPRCRPCLHDISSGTFLLCPRLRLASDSHRGRRQRAFARPSEGLDKHLQGRKSTRHLRTARI